MRAIFLSYRRDDAEGEAGRLFDDLHHRFGKKSVFMDVAGIQKGRDFREAIEESIATCGVLLAVIGSNWLDAKNEAGQRRLDDPLDLVRLETVSALKRGIPVIPVLVHGAKMPSAEQLPEDLRDLAYRNGCEITHARWNSDVPLLIKALSKYVDPPTPRRLRSFRGLIMAIALAAMAAIGLAGYLSHPQQAMVPDLTGNSSYEAARRLEAAHLLVGQKTTQEAAGKTPDTVVGQSPVANMTVKRGTPVDLIVAARPSRVVPALRGLALEAARKALSDEKLSVGRISFRVRSDMEANTVIDEYPRAGHRTALGNRVDLVVSVASEQAIKSQ